MRISRNTTVVLPPKPADGEASDWEKDFQAVVMKSEAVLETVEPASGTRLGSRAGWWAVIVLMFGAVVFVVPLWLWAVLGVGGFGVWLVRLGNRVARASRTPGPGTV